MKKGFWNGLLAGGLIGAVTTMLVGPQKKHTPRKGVLGNVRKLGSKAQEVAKEVQSGYDHLKKIID